MIKTVGFFALFSIVSSQVFAQTGLPFLQIDPAAHGVMTAGAASSTASSHPTSFFYNPAHLGFIGMNNTVSVSGFHRKVDWYPNFHSGMTYNQRSLSGGVNLSSRFHIPLSVGVGYFRSDFAHGKVHRYDGQGNLVGMINMSDHFDMVGVGLHLNYPVKVSVGYSRKYITSKYPDYHGQKYVRKVTASDLGAVFDFQQSFGPVDTRVATSMVVRNVGEKIQYFPPTPGDALPRTAVIGYELSMAYVPGFAQTTLSFIQLDWTLEASDVLVKFDPSGGWGSTRYTRWPGNISIVDHVVRGKDDREVTVRQGFRVHVLETITLGSGKLRGSGYAPFLETSGFTLSSAGVFKILAFVLESQRLTGLSERLTISFSSARIHTKTPFHYLESTRYRDLTVEWKIFR